MRLTQIITQFKEQGMNTDGEGIPDLLLLLLQWAQKTMVKRLTNSEEVQCTVLEVKVVEGHGTTIDVVLVNGVLHEGDQIVVCGMQGTYLHHKEIKAAQGIKIAAQKKYVIDYLLKSQRGNAASSMHACLIEMLKNCLEHTIAGTSIYIVRPHDNIEEIKEAAMKDVKSVMSRIARSGEGVYVQASTLGSLEALLEFLKTPAVNIPVSAINIGPVHKKDVMKASVMLEKRKEYQRLGNLLMNSAHIDNLKEEKKREAAEEAVFPCILQIMPNCVFNKKGPIVLGVQVIDGIAKFIDIGRIASIENNHKPVDRAKKGQEVAIKIIGSNSEEQQKMFGRHFETEDQLVSKISRRSVDALEENYVKCDSYVLI
ncbi:eukaryotic translation initiation factor 2 family protein [Perilla frutescens var. hirtella]|nr:eukaryotic translation initiation factor 2 family protein [Perilla frutescens var. hirtella]